MHAGPEIHVLLSISFNAFIVHGVLPKPLTDRVLVPIVEDKTKNISDKGNYTVAYPGGFSGCPGNPPPTMILFKSGGDTVTGTDPYQPPTFATFGNPP